MDSSIVAAILSGGVAGSISVAAVIFSYGRRSQKLDDVAKAMTNMTAEITSIKVEIRADRVAFNDSLSQVRADIGYLKGVQNTLERTS